MMRKWKVILTFLVLGSLAEARGPAQAAAGSGGQKGGGAPGSYSTSAALHLGGGMAYPRLLNQDGTNAVYSGSPFAGEFDFSFGVPDLGMSFSVFVHMSTGKFDNLANNGSHKQTLNQTENLYGVKASIYPFYIGMGYGSTQGRIEDDQGSPMDLNAKLIGFTGGLNLFSLTDGWQLTLAGWYKNGAFQKGQNASLTSNTVMERLDVILFLSINPLFTLL